MESMSVLAWMSRQGWAQLYLSGEIANPTTGEGAVLFAETAPVDLFLLKFTIFNGSVVPMEYAVQTYNTGTSVWDDVARWTLDAKSGYAYSNHFPLDVGEQVRVAVVANAEATGVSLCGVEYLVGS
jgi:hypothetical protein